MPADGPGEPRFAVHVVAHADPGLFDGLVTSLQHERIDVYAHIDATADEAPFRAAAAGQRVRFVPASRRVSVNWGGYSQVRATRASLDLALASGRRYHRHSLLSGVDVRVAPLPELIDRWSEDDELIRIDRPLRGSAHERKVRRHHFPDHAALAPVAGRVTAPLRRRVPSRVRLVQGSNWWSLTDGAVRWMCGELDRNPRWARYFRFAHCPDEYVFHSLVAASPFAAAITQDYSRCFPPSANDLHGQHYIRWLPGAYRPEPFTREDLSAARSSDALFARKVTGDCSWRPE